MRCLPAGNGMAAGGCRRSSARSAELPWERCFRWR